MKQSKFLVNRLTVIDATNKKIAQVEKVALQIHEAKHAKEYNFENVVNNERVCALVTLKHNIDNDPQKRTRVDGNLCPYCHYKRGMRLGMAAMTSRECGLCENVETYSSTATDILCDPCAKDNGLCKQCGADVNLAVRKDSYPFELD